MLFIGLGDTLEVVCSDDPEVTPHDPSESVVWFRRFTDKADVGKGARIFTVRPLNGREWAVVSTTHGLPRLYDGAAKATVSVYPPFTNNDGERQTVRDTIDYLSLDAVSGLFVLAQEISHGKDPFADSKEGAAPDAAPKSDDEG